MNSSNSHIIAFTVLQIIIAVLFLLFVRSVSLSNSNYLKSPNQVSLLYCSLDMTQRLPRRMWRVLKKEPSRSRMFTPVINLMRNIRILITIKPSLSVPRRPCDDLHWFWFPDDFPEEVRFVRRLPQHDLLGPGHRGLHPRLRLLSPPL